MLARYVEREGGGGTPPAKAERRTQAAPPKRQAILEVKTDDDVGVWREESVTITRVSSPRRRYGIWLGTLAVVAIALAFMFGKGWLPMNLGGGDESAPSEQPPGDDSSAGESTGDAGVAGDTADTRTDAAPTGAGDHPAGGGDQAAPSTPAYAGPMAPQDEQGVQWPPPPASLHLEVIASGPCRLSITIDGKRHVGRRFPAQGGSWDLAADEFFLLSAERGEELTLLLNGRAFPLPEMAGESLVALRVELPKTMDL